MSESGDYDPGPWRGYNFKSARKSYDVHVGRSYDDAKSQGKSIDDLIPKNIETDSTSPLVIACDVTGSMGDWPATIFSKLPYLDLEGKEYLGKDMEISFAAVGDSHGDEYPLQVRPFAKGKKMQKELKELVIEGGGGDGIRESYDLAAIYYAHKVKMPKAVNPIFIFIGDEKLYDPINKGHAKRYIGVNFEENTSAKKIIKDLQKKYSVYLVQKAYHGDSGRGDEMGPTTKEVHKQWASMLGEDHISILPNADRVVDVIFGIFAKETDRVPYFQQELSERQKPGQVKTVLTALESVHEMTEAEAQESIKLLTEKSSKTKSKKKNKKKIRKK